MSGSARIGLSRPGMRRVGMERSGLASLPGCGRFFWAFGPGVFDAARLDPGLMSCTSPRCGNFLGPFGTGVFGPGVFGPGVFGPGVFGPGVFGPGVFGPGVFGPGVFDAARLDPGLISSTSPRCENFLGPFGPGVYGAVRLQPRANIWHLSEVRFPIPG
jgi:hypothetical protein